MQYFLEIGLFHVKFLFEFLVRIITIELSSILRLSSLRISLSPSLSLSIKIVLTVLPFHQDNKMICRHYRFAKVVFHAFNHSFRIEVPVVELVAPIIVLQSPMHFLPFLLIDLRCHVLSVAALFSILVLF